MSLLSVVMQGHWDTFDWIINIMVQIMHSKTPLLHALSVLLVFPMIIVEDHFNRFLEQSDSENYHCHALTNNIFKAIDTFFGLIESGNAYATGFELANVMAMVADTGIRCFIA